MNTFQLILAVLFIILLIFALLDAWKNRDKVTTADTDGIFVEKRVSPETGDVTVVEQAYVQETGDVAVVERSYDGETGELTGVKFVEQRLEDSGEVTIIEKSFGAEAGDGTVLEHTYEPSTGELTGVSTVEQKTGEGGDVTVVEATYDLKSGDEVVVEHTYEPDTGELTEMRVVQQDYVPETGELVVTEHTMQPESGEMTVVEAKFEPVADELFQPEAVVPDMPAFERAAEVAPVLDDLKIIEGIGPKMSSILHQAGIHTFSELASTSVEKLDEILSAAGMITGRTKTWAEQARLAAAGDWDGLKTLQENLKGGL